VSWAGRREDTDVANWSLPTNTSLYTDYTAQHVARTADLAVGLDPARTTATNVPTHSVRWNSATARWQIFNGSSWVDLASVYQISITGNAGTATTLQNARLINGVSFNGSADITITSNTTQALTFNNGGAGVASGTTFNGSTARTISYNTIGAPSTSGTNASGNWAINVTGSAATLTTARNINGVSFNGSADIVVDPYTDDDEATNATRYVTFVASTTQGYQRLREDSGLTYNPSTNTLTTSIFSGALSGNATTATTLQTARTINGVSFNGSANITVTANTPQALTYSTTGNGVASGSYNGSTAQTLSYNTVGAPSVTGANASGTWGISITGSSASTTGNAATVTNGVYTTGNQTVGGTKTFSSATIFPDGTVTAPGIRFTTEANTGFYRAGTNTIGVATAGTVAATFDASGNTNVLGKLQTSGNQSVAAWTTSGQSFDSSAATFTDTTTAAAGTVATRTINSFNTPTLASTNAITVTNASTAYIAAAPTAGTNTTITNAHALHIAGGRTFMAAGSATVPALAVRDVNTGLYSAGTGQINVTTSGTLSATFNGSDFTSVGNVTAYSDIRLKTDLVRISDALAKVSQLGGYTYTRVDTGERQTGVVAQEVQAVLPEAVIDNGETLAVAYGNMVGLLIEAVKELTARVESLEAR